MSAAPRAVLILDRRLRAGLEDVIRLTGVRQSVEQIAAETLQLMVEHVTCLALQGEATGRACAFASCSVSTTATKSTAVDISVLKRGFGGGHAAR